MKFAIKIQEFYFHLSKSLILCSLLTLSILSCSDSKSTQPDLSAIPHAEALPSTELSDADKEQLLKASGKSIENINMTDLQNMMSASTGKVYVYAFWHSACKVCLSNIENLKEVVSDIGSEKMKVITLNVGDNDEKVDLFVRSQNIAFETYKLKTKNDSWNTLIDENWDGSLPAIFLINKSEEIFLKYYKSLQTNEISAIIQTLII